MATLKRGNILIFIHFSECDCFQIRFEIMSFTKKTVKLRESKENLDNARKVSSSLSSSAYASSGSFSINESDLRETAPFNKDNTPLTKMEEHLNSKNNRKFSNQASGKCCTRKKLFIICLIFLYLTVDFLINLIFVTEIFSKMPSFMDYTASSSLIDIWIVSLAKCGFLLTISLLVVIRHEIVINFIRFVHSKYISLLVCLGMYSFAIIKMLLHAETRDIKVIPMAMFIWNFFSSFLFFGCWYMLKLLKLRKLNMNRNVSLEEDSKDNDDEKSTFIGL